MTMKQTLIVLVGLFTSTLQCKQPRNVGPIGPRIENKEQVLQYIKVTKMMNITHIQYHAGGDGMQQGMIAAGGVQEGMAAAGGVRKEKCLGGSMFTSCCHKDNPCGVDEGDCNKDIDCLGDLKCRENSCPKGSSFLDSDDCCQLPSNVNYKCDGGDSCCTKDRPCGENEGDCDSDDDCQDGLRCGDNNCPPGGNFKDDDDCCVKPENFKCTGGNNCCTFKWPCGENEGDCDSEDQCQDDLKCGESNCPEGHDDDDWLPDDCCYRP